MFTSQRELALICKVLAVIIWVGEALIKSNWDIHEMHMLQGWGKTPNIQGTYLEILALSGIALFSAAPNRWLVFSPIAFCISLSIAVFPFFFVVFKNLSGPFNTVGVVFSPANSIAMILIFGPLPLSLAMSFLRQRGGEKISYI
ncbi:MAG TPA: hypothetical protein VNV43_15020 [Candidatus Acidoferrales bacterium]|jgi:hypothetical protein|nr:hypothetical protein [Candidatus Acidoferrales bacterium]